MTYTKKQVLPALHDSKKLNKPDMPDVGQQNYTSTVLKYANLSLPFPQLDTNAKRVVPAINELWNNRVVANPPIEGSGYQIVSEDGYIIVSEDGYIVTSEGGGDAQELNTIKIDGVIYKIVGEGHYELPIASSSELGGVKVGTGLFINSNTGVLSTMETLDHLYDVNINEPTAGQVIKYDGETHKWVNAAGGGGSDYSAGNGIYFTDDTVINAEAGRKSKLYTYFNMSSEWGQSGEYSYRCWDDYEIIDDHQVYRSYGGTYLCSEGNSLCTFTVSGYKDVTFYIKQDSEDTNTAYTVLGRANTPIDLENEVYEVSYKDTTLDDFVAYRFENLYGQTKTFEVLYHTDPLPSSGTVSVDLNNGQWADSGTTVDGNTVYMSDSGSYHVSNGRSVCTITISGLTSFTLYYRPSSESNYDFVYVGNLDQNVSTSNYKDRWSGNPSRYDAVDYTCTEDTHTIQIMYQKDGSVNEYDDRGYFYYVINGDVHTTHGYVYAVPGEVYPTELGEVFNDYMSNYATSLYAHAEGSRSHAFGYASHSEGSSNTSSGSCSHAEGDNTKATGSCTHTEGFNTTASGEDSHAEGHWAQALAAFSHAEGYGTVASGDTAHAENRNTIASGENSHAEGRETQATAQRAHAEGGFTVASASAAHAEGYRSVASGEDSHAEGYYATASGFISHAEGYEVTAGGSQSHAEGTHTTTNSYSSHAEGYYTLASGEGAHAEGYGDSNNVNTASGTGSHCEGGITKATGNFSHCEGYYNVASGNGSHAEGYGGYSGANTAAGISAHVEGGGNTVSGNCGHSEGTRNTVYSESGHAEGSGNHLYGREAHIEGSGNNGTEQSSHTEGAGNNNIAMTAHIEGAGNSNTSFARISHTEGAGNRNYGHQSHLEGAGNILSGEESHLEGAGNSVHGDKAHGEGGGNTSYGMGAHIEGKHNFAAGYAQHIEGMNNFVGYSELPAAFTYGTSYSVGNVVGANANYLGYTVPETDTPALFRCVTAPGQIQAGNGVTIITPSSWSSSTTYAAGDIVLFSGLGFYYADAASTGSLPSAGYPWTKITEVLSPFRSYQFSYTQRFLLDCNDAYGANAIAVVTANTTLTPMWEPITTSHAAHVEGIGNISLGDYQHIQGKFNVSDSTKAFIIGNGTDVDHRSNALTVDWSGNADIAGDLTTGVTLTTTAQTVGAAINELAASSATTLDSLSNVDITTPANKDVLQYNSTTQQWENGPVSGGGGGSSTLSGLTDVALSTPTDNQVLKYNATNQVWENGAAPGGIDNSVKTSLLACFSHVMWDCPISDTQTYYNDLREALYPGVILTSITCVYTQTQPIYPSSDLDELKNDLVVTAHYSDNSSDEITYYTLSGTLTTGTSTITVDYLGDTTTFNVTVDRPYLYVWDFTQSLVDKVQGVSANLRAASGATLPVRTSNGVELTAATQGITFLNNFTFAGKTIEFDIVSMVFGGSKSNHIRMFMFGSNNYSGGCGPLIWRYGTGWATYNSGWTGVWSGLGGTSDEIINYMSGKTVKLVFHSDARNVTLYIDDTLIETKSLYNSYSNMRYLYFGGDADSASSGDQCYNVTLSGFRIYENE